MFTFEFGFPLTFIALPFSTNTCTAHQEVHPWQVVDFHWPGSVGCLDLEVCAKALKVGFKTVPRVATAAAAVAVFKKLLRLIMFSFSFILKTLQSSISSQIVIKAYTLPLVLSTAPGLKLLT